MTLSFVHEARFHFDPVARQFDLRCVESNESRIQYENNQVLLIVNFDNRRSFELGVEIAKKDVHFPGPPFSLAEVLRLRGVHDSASESAVMVSDQAPRSDALAHLAELTRRHAADFLAGSDFAFAQVARLRNKEGAELELTNRLRNSRSHAEMAWKAKDYAAVVKALEPIEEHLSLVDKNGWTTQENKTHGSDHSFNSKRKPGWHQPAKVKDKNFPLEEAQGHSLASQGKGQNSFPASRRKSRRKSFLTLSIALSQKRGVSSGKATT